MKDVKFINRLKLRGSYGQTGSQKFSAYQAVATYAYYLSDRIIPDDTFTPAEIQNLLMRHKKEPQVAVDVATEWVKETLEEKEKVRKAKEDRDEDEDEEDGDDDEDEGKAGGKGTDDA